MSSARVRSLDLDAVMAALRQWAGSLAGLQEVRQVVRIGSLAHGTWSTRSDADVVVVVNEHTADGELRYRPSGALGIGLDLFVRTDDEIAAMGKRFAAEVAAGLPLFER